MGWVLLSIGAVIYAVMSLVTLAAFALDKARAKLDARRTPEKVLHTLSALGGFPGALAAMILVRHKNRKPGFVALTAIIGLGHVLAWVLLIVAWRVLR